MLPTIHIDQLALKKWHGKIDAADAIIVALIRSLNADNPLVKKYMFDEYFMFNREWVLGMIPLIDISEDTLSHRLVALEKIGLVDRRIWTNKLTGKYTLYVRLSRLYWAEENRQHKELEATVDENAHGRTRQTPSVNSPTNHNIMIRETPPPLVAAGGVISEEDFAALRFSLPWAETQEVVKQ
jgi:hypothetical protein